MPGFDEPIKLSLRANCRAVRATWKNGQIVVTAPASITAAHLQEILIGFKPKLLQIKPEAPYYLGQDIVFEDFTVCIRAQQRDPSTIYSSAKNRRLLIEIGEEWGMDDPDTIKQIAKYVGDYAHHIAPQILLPLAHRCAKEAGVSPAAWKISYGHKVLGHCDSKRKIALSHNLLYYPTHLRHYVIMHELAHLTEMNHSAAFHEVCNRYCGGREAELEAQLRAFRPQIK